MRATDLYDAPPNVRDAQMGWTPGSNMFANYTHLRPEKVEDVILEREGAPVLEPAEDIHRRLDEIYAIMEANDFVLRRESLPGDVYGVEGSGKLKAAKRDKRTPYGMD